MAAAVTNPFKLTWGSFECGGTTERLIVGLHRIQKDFVRFEVTLDVLVRGTSDADFATQTTQMESEFAKRRQLIKFEVGASTIQTFNPADGTNTGLNSYARIDKIGTPGADTDRSRLYTLTVGCELPATDASGRRDSLVTVEPDASNRRTVTISGVWTAITSNNATAQYAAQIDSYCSSVLSGLSPSATFEAINHRGRTERDDQDKTLSFTRVYREILIAQPGGSLDNASIVDPVFTMTRSSPFPGDSCGGGVRRLDDIALVFSCSIDKAQTLDIDALYTDTVRPYLIERMVAEYAPNAYYIKQEDRQYDKHGNTLAVTILITAAIGASDVIESVMTSRIVESSGVVMTGVWSGGLFDKYADQGHATRLRFAIMAVRKIGRHAPTQRVGRGKSSPFVEQEQCIADGGGDGGAPVVTGASASGRWVLKENDSSATVKWCGDPDGEQMIITDLVDTVVEEWIADPPAVTGPTGVGVPSARPGGSAVTPGRT